MYKAFEVHMLNEVGKLKARKIAEAFNTLAEEMEPLCLSGREHSIMITKLEEACFFAKKAMALDVGNQQ